MKTAEEWMKQLGGHDSTGEHPPIISINRMTIREIQLDATKEGMRRAAILLNKLPEKRSLMYNHEQAILTATEQLTEKDLP